MSQYRDTQPMPRNTGKAHDRPHTEPLRRESLRPSESAGDPAAVVEPQGRAGIAWAILALALILGAGLRWMQMDGKRTFARDDTISYLAATGHLGEYQRIVSSKSAPYGQWVRAGEWKRFIRPEQPLCLATISRDLGDYDIHPPLYFWLLHVWLLLFGAGLASGVTLNIFLSILTTVALYALGLRVFRAAVPAALAAFLHAVSPTVLPAAFEARQYDLLGLCAVLFVWQSLRFLEGNRAGWPQVLMSGAAALAGLLCHFHFPILIAGAWLLCAARRGRRDRRLLGKYSSGLLLAALLFVALHPGFYNSIRQAGKQAQSFDGDKLGERFSSVCRRYTSFVVDCMALQRSNQTLLRSGANAVGYAGIFAIAVLIGGTWFAHRRFARRGKALSCGSQTAANDILILFAWSAGANALLYLCFISPAHAMEPKHPAMVWPLMALSLVIAIRSSGRTSGVLMILLGLTTLSFGVNQARYYQTKWLRLPDPAMHLQEARHVLADNTRRGVFPRFFLHFPDNVEVFAAHQERLTESQSLWLEEMRPGDLFVCHHPGGQQLTASSSRTLRMLGERFNVRRVRSGVWGVNDLYLLEAPQSAVTSPH